MGLFWRETPEERRLKLEMVHAERMKALEKGRPLPEVEVARHHADEVRAKMETGREVTRTIFMAVGPLAFSGVAVGATAVILTRADPGMHLVLVSVVWICSALVSLGLIASSVFLSGRVRWRDLLSSPPAASPRKPERGAPLSDETVDIEGPLAPEEVERLSRAFQK